MLRLALFLASLTSTACAAPYTPFPGDGPPSPATSGEEDPGVPAAQEASVRAGSAPRLVGEIVDGTILDVAGTPAGPWIATGRNLRRLDPETGEPADLHPAAPFDQTVHCIEATPDGGLVVGTRGAVQAFAPDGTARTFHTGELGVVADLKLLGGSGRIAALIGAELVVLGPEGEDGLALLGRSGPTRELLSLERLSVLEHGGFWTVGVVGTPRSATSRGVRALLVAELGRDGTSPRFHGKAWDPATLFSDRFGSAQSVRLVAEGERRVAYVASGVEGQLARLDVTRPGTPELLERIVLHPQHAVSDVSLDQERGLLYVASINQLHVLDLASRRVLGSVHVPFHAAGDRDMGLCVLPDGRRILWTSTRREVEHALNAVDVTRPDAPRRSAQRWWIGSSDGAVAILPWDSVYLPTWGGVARYDISDPSRPEPRGYQPARTAATEHIHWAWREPGSQEEAWLVTAGGNAQVMLWPVSRTQPDPGPPRTFEFTPPGMQPIDTYQLDAVPYRRDGELYILSDLADRATDRVALRALRVSTGTWVYTAEEDSRLLANAQDVTVAGDLAFVTVRGGFFVVRLDRLPRRLEVVGEHVISVGPDRFRANGVALTADRRTLFLGCNTPGRVVSFQYDPRSHRLSRPLSVLEDIPAVTGRIRLHEPSQRLYAAARGGRVLEIDVSDPRRLRLLSTWQAPGYDGPMQDVILLETPDGPLVLASKTNEGFALLAPSRAAE